MTKEEILQLCLKSNELVDIERKDQIENKEYTLENDLKYENQELARAGATYALPDNLRKNLFPFETKYWNPREDNRISELVKAGALILAQIDVEIERGRQNVIEQIAKFHDVRKSQINIWFNQDSIVYNLDDENGNLIKENSIWEN